MARSTHLALNLALIALSAAPSTAFGTPGPATTVVIANANVPASITLAERYASERAVPAGQVCVLDVEDVEDVDLADYESSFLLPLRACLDRTAGARERIEAAVLIRGLPLRVRVPVGGGNQVVSLAAALMLWDSTIMGAPLLGSEPGNTADCGGTACYAPAWRNPYRGFPFESGWTRDASGVTWRPLLVTMLHGRTYEAAGSLLTSALEAERSGAPDGEMLFMDGRDPARGVLDGQYDRVIADLAALGFTASRVAFDSDLTGRTLASFVTGTATLGTSIEGNTFQPGSIVDNLTSFGAVPENFRETGERQVSIARWVEQGVAGAHGTVAEPLNGSFPHRRFLVEYVLGATLAEAYHSMMPDAYWRNLVLGDPMAAPHAMRPELDVTGIMAGASIDGARQVQVSAMDPLSTRGVASIIAYLGGVEVARSDADTLAFCLVAPAGDDQQLLIVARAGEDPADERIWQPKGWTALTFSSGGTATECGAADAGASEPDGAATSLDAGVGGNSDAGTDPPSGDGCSCRAAPPSRRSIPWLGLIALGLLRRRT